MQQRLELHNEVPRLDDLAWSICPCSRRRQIHTRPNQHLHSVAIPLNSILPSFGHPRVDAEVKPLIVSCFLTFHLDGATGGQHELDMRFKASEDPDLFCFLLSRQLRDLQLNPISSSLQDTPSEKTLGNVPNSKQDLNIPQISRWMIHG